MIGTALIVAALLQAPAPAQADQKPGAIRGRVSAADTGKPLVRANVMVVSSGGTANVRLSANTDARGIFEVRSVPPGQYTITASRGGYLRMQYGQRRPNDLGLTIEVTEGSDVDRIDIALPRGGVLGGRITDELGDPYTGVRVDILGTHYDHGKRVPFPVGVGTTDDLGQFRVAGLPPGSYYVVAATNETWLTEKKETYGYASTYYPGGPIDVAQTITLAPSQQRLNLDFALQGSRTARVRGRVVDARGAPVGGSGVMIAAGYPGVVVVQQSRVVRTERDGSFEIKDVPPGVYEVQNGSASQTVTVAGVDIDGIVLAQKRGSTVSGTFVTEDGTPPPFSSVGVRVQVIAPDDDKVLPTVRVKSADSNWTFTFENLGGPFLFRPIGLPDGWMLASVRLGERDITDVAWDVATGGEQIAGVQIVLTPKVGRVSGTVADANNAPTSGATVVLFTDDDKLWMPGSRLVRSARPDREGRFSFVGLPPGTYLVIAREFVEAGEWEDRAFLEAARDQAQRVVLGDGGRQTIALRLPSR